MENTPRDAFITKESEPPILFAYTRAQAIADGVLVDVSDMAKEAGFKFPVAMTRTVWDAYVAVPNGVTGQDENGRCWDILFMLQHAIKTQKSDGATLLFSLVVRQSDNLPAEEVTLKSVCGPGDDPQPVITIMGKDED